jgi:hypothetical protein
MSEGTLVAVVAPDGAFASIDGPELPMTLSGLHSASWSFDFDKLVDLVKTGHARARVISRLATVRCQHPGSTFQERTR